LQSWCSCGTGILHASFELLTKADALSTEQTHSLGRCVDAWLDDQTNRYADVLDKVIHLEMDNQWRPLPHSGVSASVVDLFQMFNESVPQLFRLGLPIEINDARSIAEKVNLPPQPLCMCARPVELIKTGDICPR
jgi:hypothetical protein